MGEGRAGLGMSSCSLDAPAKHHRRPSPDPESSTAWTLVRFPSKTQALRCFRSSQDTTITKELKPPRSFPGKDLAACFHQELKELEELGGCTSVKLRLHSTWSQTSLASTQEVRRWYIVSSCCSQKGQANWCGRPCLDSWSDVQHRLLMANQMKNLQLGGGATFPNSPPRKEPDRTNKHGEISWTAAVGAWRIKSGWRITSSTKFQTWRYSTKIWIVRAPLISET